MDDSKTERARQYVRGGFSDGEAREFEALLREDAELRAMVLNLRRDASASGGPSNQTDPRRPPLAGSLVSKRPFARPGSAASAPEAAFERGGFPYWLPWLLGAFLAVFSIILLVEGQSEQKDLMQLQGELDQARWRNQRSLVEIEGLRRAVRALRQHEQPTEFEVKWLIPAASAGEGVAVVVWDLGTQRGLFAAENLPPPSAGRDYQLWVFDSRDQPSSLGVVKVGREGRGRLEFELPPEATDKFSLSLEVEGGVAQPEGPVVLSR